MSSWWYTAFFVVGDVHNVRKFEHMLPLLFHEVADADRVGGGLVAEVLQNYGGGAAVEAAISRFPSLMFNGARIHEQAQPGDTFWVFTGIDGVTEWRELCLPDDARQMTRDDVEKEIARLNEKAARLTAERELFLDRLRNVHADITKDTGSPADPLRQSDEVVSIAEKIRRRRLEVNDAANVPEAIPKK